MENIEKIDMVRGRMDVTYEEAKLALEATNWDVVEAIIQIERDEKDRKEEIFVRGNELVEKIKEIVRKGNINRLRVKQDDTILIEIPVTAGVVGALLAPQLAIIGAVAALVSKCTVEIERRDETEVYH
ncbi:MAG TPA: ubiquitin [Firmicutes bacterium]|nr:ubiquitin [Bacillota bacterium]